MHTLKLIIFDVEHGFCGYILTPNGYSLMVDCGARPDFSPVDYLLSNSSIYFPRLFQNKQLTKLIVTHPHGDHIQDIQNLHEKLSPAFLYRTELSSYMKEDLDLVLREKQDSNLKLYREKLDEAYIYKPVELPDWGVVKRTYFSLTPDEARLVDPAKVINNTSIVLLLECYGRKILYGGDLETAGWEALIKYNKKNFKEKVAGVDIFMAPHHGHKSGFSKELFDIMGKPLVNIVSKNSEVGETDVHSDYSNENFSRGLILNNQVRRKLTTRNDGSIIIDIYSSGQMNFNTVNLTF